jgi:O-antigen ligase
MRVRSSGRLAFVFLAIYFVFLGGSAYYHLVFPIRLFHHALVTILLAVWLIGRIRRGQGLPQTPLIWPIFATVIVWLVSALTSIDRRMAFENLWFPFIHIIFFFVLVDLLQRGRERLVMEAQFMIAAAVIFLSGLELASWYFGLGIIPSTDIGWINVIGPGAWLPLQLPRLSLAMNISTLLAGYVAPLVTITGIWAMTARRRDFRAVLTVMAIALIIILILTFSRGGLLSVLTAVATLVVFRLGRNPQIIRMVPSRTFYVAAIVVGIVSAGAFMAYSASQSQSRNFGDAGRLDMWSSAVRITGDNPLLGIGPGLFGRAFRDYRNPTLAQDKLASAHNAYLNTAAETGLAGVAACLWLAGAFIGAWYQNWHTASDAPRKLRLEASFAALLGIGVHSLVDVFTITPIVLLILLLVAYCIVGKETVIQPSVRRWTEVAALVGILAYGVWFFQLDRAQIHYQRSLRGDEAALAEAQAAAELDPALTLYPLQITYLIGQQTIALPDSELEPAISAYNYALELEPTWDIGWINLAALMERQGELASAINYLDIARKINVFNTASLHWARLSEQTGSASDQDIIEAYMVAMTYNSTLPLSSFWTETDLRWQALERYLEPQEPDVKYRILAVHDPEQAYALVVDEPNSAAGWWVAGEYALTVENNHEAAISNFTQAIQRSPLTGDYYVSRARAEATIAPTVAQRDLDLAQLLGTLYEYPNEARAQLASNPDEMFELRATALPPYQVLPEFASVLYGRAAIFDVFPQMRRIGPGRAAMQPWYEIAEQRLAAGDTDGAIRAYSAILDYAPDEQEAREHLEQLSG